MLTPISGSPPGSRQFVVKFVYEDSIPAANTLLADCVCGYEGTDLKQGNTGDKNMMRGISAVGESLLPVGEHLLKMHLGYTF